MKVATAPLIVISMAKIASHVEFFSTLNREDGFLFSFVLWIVCCTHRRVFSKMPTRWVRVSLEKHGHGGRRLFPDTISGQRPDLQGGPNLLSHLPFRVFNEQIAERSP
jgi:hypothetical protein